MVDATVVWALLVLSLEPTSSGLQFGLKPTKIPDKETLIQKTAKLKHSSYLLNMPMEMYSIYFTKRSIQLKFSIMYSKLTLFDPGPTCISAAVPRFSLQFQLIH